MGRLVRRYIRTSHLEVSNYVAIAGSSEAVKGAVYTNLATGVLNLVGLHAKTSTPTGKNQGGGYQYGVYIENEVLGNAVHAGLFEGIRLEQYVESGVTLTGAIVHGIHIANSISAAPLHYYFMRMSEDGTATVTAVFQITKGASCTDISYLFELSGAAGYWSGVGTVTSPAGYLKIQVTGAVSKYIQLYNTPP